MNTYSLTNAETMAALHSNTFQIPPAGERQGLVRGDFAKLIFSNAERMWVEITGIAAKSNGHARYTGHPASDPTRIFGLKFGDPISFGSEHVIEVRRRPS